jgi:hypothetical protein
LPIFNANKNGAFPRHWPDIGLGADFAMGDGIDRIGVELTKATRKDNP